MKLLYVIPSLEPAAGGTAEMVKIIGKSQQDLGHQVEVLSLDVPGSPWLIQSPIKVHALGKGLLFYGYNPKMREWLLAHASEYDAIIINGLWQYTSFGTWSALRKKRLSYFVFTHGMLDPWFKETYPLKHLKKWLYWPWTDYRVLRDARAVFFTSEQERLLARRSFWLYRCVEKVVSLGTLPPPGDRVLQRELFFQQFPNLKAKRIILFLGRVHEKKGCDLLIQAFASLLSEPACANREEIHLVIAGPCASAAYLEELQQLAARTCPASSVTWTGLLSGDVKWGALHAAEIFALPSHNENFGISVSESISCGVPVLISNKVNIFEEIERDGAGLVENDDLEGARRLLSRWFSMPAEKQQAMKEASERCFLSRFEAHGAARRVIDMIAAS